MVTRKWRSRLSSERGQMLLLFVGFITVFLVMAAVVVDLGLWMAERRDVQKVADLAAAAGAQELPVDDSAAIDSACNIAAANGYGDGNCGPGDPVEIVLLCNSGLSGVPGICSDAPGGRPSLCSAGQGCDTIRVKVRGQGPVLFSSIFGVTPGDAAVSSGAAAGLRWGETAIDGVLLLDSSSSMGAAPCNVTQDNSGCPMKEARDAATAFVEFLLGQGGDTRAGYAAYTHCYLPTGATATPAPTATPPPSVAKPCLTRDDNVIDITDDGDAIEGEVALALGNGDTNLCVPLAEAQRMFAAAGTSSGATRAVVLLTDGDNNVIYDAATQVDLPADCPLPAGSQFRRPCPGNAFPFEQALDLQTREKADALKSSGIQVYVVGFAVCGADDGATQYTSGYCDGIGNTNSDAAADQRLLKCIASSPAHYFRVDSAEDLPGVFRQVAAAILGRRLMQ